MRDRRGMRVRTLMVLVALASLPMCCIGYPLSRLREANRAAAPFLALGGSVRDSGDGMSRLDGPAGLYGVDLRGCGVDDGVLRRLRGPLLRLPNLSILWLDENPISDEGLVHLRDLSRMEHLRVL